MWSLATPHGISVEISSNIAQQSTFLIEGNLIGTNAAGNQALGNVDEGLVVSGVYNCSITANVVSGNGSAGIVVNDGSAGDVDPEAILSGPIRPGPSIWAMATSASKLRGARATLTRTARSAGPLRARAT